MLRPRSWWIRIALLLLVGVIALGIAWTVWWARAKAEYDTQVALLRALGNVTSSRTVQIPDIPPDEDATMVFDKALTAFAVKPMPPSHGIDPSYLAVPEALFTEAWMAQAQAAIRANTKPLQLAIAASALPRCTPTYDVARQMPRISNANCSTFARFLADAALYYHVAGDDEAAMDCLLALQTIPRIYSSGHSFIEPLIAIICQNIAAPPIQFIAAGLRVEGTPSAADAIRPARRAQVQRLLGALYDDRTFVASLPAACSLMAGDTVEFVERSPLRITRPLLYRHQARYLELQRPIITALEQLDWSASEAARRKQYIGVPTEEFGTLAELVQSNVARFASPNGDLFAAIAGRRMAATAVAFRLYTLDHGKWPQAFADLVPSYLPAIPADPFAVGHAPLSYRVVEDRLEGNLRPIVFSVGPSQNPRPEVPPSHGYAILRAGNYGSTIREPLVLDLSRPRFTAQPSAGPARSPTVSVPQTPPVSPPANRP